MKRLKELRQKKNLSQQALADIFHITQQSVYKYENDLATPDIETLKNMATYFDTTIDYIVDATDIPFRIDSYSPEYLSPTEKEVINYYRKSTPEIQNLIIQAIHLIPLSDKN